MCGLPKAKKKKKTRHGEEPMGGNTSHVAKAKRFLNPKELQHLNTGGGFLGPGKKTMTSSQEGAEGKKKKKGEEHN